MTPRRIARTALRLFALGSELAWAALGMAAGRGDGALGVHRLSRRLLRVFGMEVRVRGPVPRYGLITCNHLGYIDVVVLAATAPTVFVAKSDVESWPVFGWFARRSGTIFVERGRAGGSAESARRIAAALASGRRVVVFPEGTSSGGESVLPFKSSLLEPGRGGSIWAAALDYSLDEGEGDPAEDVCYWRDMTLVPHLMKILGKRRIRATLSFSPIADTHLDRKTLARFLRTRVIELRGQVSDIAAAGVPATAISET